LFALQRQKIVQRLRVTCDGPFCKAQICRLPDRHFSPSPLHLDVDVALEGISRHRRSVTHALGSAFGVAALSGLKLRRSRRTAVANGVTGAWLVNLFAHLEHDLFNGAQVGRSVSRKRARRNAAAAELPLWLSADRFLAGIAGRMQG